MSQTYFALPVFNYQLANNYFITRSLYLYVWFFNIELQIECVIVPWSDCLSE